MVSLHTTLEFVSTLVYRLKQNVSFGSTGLINSNNQCTLFLANVNSCSCSLFYVVVRPSVVCNVRAPYSAD